MLTTPTAVGRGVGLSRPFVCMSVFCAQYLKNQCS